MRMSAPIGGKLPMHASGAGKAFLSQLSEEQVTGLLHRKGLHAYTHATTGVAGASERRSGSDPQARLFV